VHILSGIMIPEIHKTPPRESRLHGQLVFQEVSLCCRLAYSCCQCNILNEFASGNIFYFLQKTYYPTGLPECGTDALRFALCTYTSQGKLGWV